MEEQSCSKLFMQLKIKPIQLTRQAMCEVIQQLPITKGDEFHGCKHPITHIPLLERASWGKDSCLIPVQYIQEHICLFRESSIGLSGEGGWSCICDSLKPLAFNSLPNPQEACKLDIFYHRNKTGHSITFRLCWKQTGKVLKSRYCQMKEIASNCKATS